MEKQIIFIATGWGSQYGGINSFNYDLCISTAKLLEGYYQIICVIQDTNFSLPSTEGLPKNLYFVKSHVEESSTRIIRNIENETRGEPELWIGHDVKTGNIAIECAKKTNKKSAVFHHMNYQAYSTYQNLGNAEKTLQKIEIQKEVLSSADFVLAVGPSLYDSAVFLLQKARKNKENCFEIIPGLAEIDPIKEPTPQFLQAVTYGRLDDDIVKQGMVAIGAFAKSIKNSSKSLYVIGVSDKDTYDEKYSEIYNDLNKFSLEHSNYQRVNLIPLPYKDRDKVFEELRVSSVSMMLSLHEGFGLAGWEAIAAEVPLVISKNTGLFQFLERDFSHLLNCIHSVVITGGDQKIDINTVSIELDKIFSDVAKNKKLARDLKEALQHYTWERTSKSFLVSCMIHNSQPFIYKRRRLVEIKEDLSNFLEDVESIIKESNQLLSSLPIEQRTEWIERNQSWKKAKIGEFIEEDKRTNKSVITNQRRDFFLEKREIRNGRIGRIRWVKENHNPDKHGALPQVFADNKRRTLNVISLSFDSLVNTFESNDPKFISPWLTYYILYLNIFEFPEKITQNLTSIPKECSDIIEDNKRRTEVIEWLKFKLISSLPDYVPLYQEMITYINTRIEALDKFFELEYYSNVSN